MNPLDYPLIVLGVVGRDRIPNALRLRMGWVRFVVAVALFGSIAFCLLALILGVTRGYWIVSGAWPLLWPLLGLPVVVLGLPRLAAHRFMTRVRAADYLVCMNCGRNLRGLPQEHQCPECGRPYNAADLPALWKAWKRRRPQPTNELLG